jgi:hypothetical protein
MSRAGKPCDTARRDLEIAGFFHLMRIGDEILLGMER